MTELQIWLNQTLAGQMVFTGPVSMLPVVELRGGIPFGVGIGLPLPLTVLASVVGNMLPIPFLILSPAGSLCGFAATSLPWRV